MTILASRPRGAALKILTDDHQVHIHPILYTIYFSPLALAFARTSTYSVCSKTLAMLQSLEVEPNKRTQLMSYSACGNLMIKTSVFTVWQRGPFGASIASNACAALQSMIS